MMFVNHLVLSVTSWHVANHVGIISNDEVGLLSGYLLVALGTALPDIDHPTSTLGRRMKWLSWPIHFLFGHRNITHSLLSMAVLGYLATLYPFLIPLTFGYLFHLVGDWLTPAGIKLLWPLPATFRSPITISTNSYSEYIIVWGVCAFTFFGLHGANLVNHL